MGAARLAGVLARWRLIGAGAHRVTSNSIDSITSTTGPPAPSSTTTTLQHALLPALPACTPFTIPFLPSTPPSTLVGASLWPQGTSLLRALVVSPASSRSSAIEQGSTSREASASVAQ